MTKWIILVFSLFSVGVNSQEVKGYVFDSRTKEPVAGASIYYDGSSIGTITDENGNFEIGLFYQNNATLVIRHLGYRSKKYPRPSGDVLLKIALTEEVENLNEIVVTSDPFSRKQKMRVFKLEFLGDTRGGRNAEILNENDIKLFFNSYDNTLSAYCDKPIVVKNDYLGYIIHFDVEEFKISFKQKSLDRVDNIYHTLYNGSTQFEDISETDLKTTKRREKAYLGSSMHFMRSCWNGDIASQNFKLKKKYREIELEEFMISSKDSTSKLKNFKFLGNQYVIYHKKKSNYRSTLRINDIDAQHSLDRYGNYTPFQNLIFGGYMANFRIGELLPMDYGLEER